ncbi:MAG: dihydroorotate dehydrogenase electron transfer subunit [Desulfovibrionaceae bacterium]|nr:dihydroorotate dehydrogenase electron transfer subunit [Desulfovibrionaceae bacterium]
MDNQHSTRLKVLDLVPFGQADPLHHFYALRLARPAWTQWEPGQFIMIRPDSFGLEIPWGRPLGICQLNQRHLICFFQVVGRGTQKLAELKIGEEVTVWGPLGHGFNIEDDTQTLLLAGGMGIVPFVGYVYSHPKPWNLTMLFGHRAPLDCYPVDTIKERIALDTLRETVPGDLDNLIFNLEERIHDLADQNGLVLACGPRPFLKTVQNFALKFNVRAQLSLENRMACGVGACLGCVTQTTEKWPEAEHADSYVQVCTKGPVFWAHQITL